MKQTKLNWKELLWEILGWISWRNDSSDKKLYEFIKNSQILKPEFIVIDEVENQEVCLFDDFDNPYMNLSTIESIQLAENSLKKLPSRTDYEMDQWEISSLLLYFNSVKASINWQVSIYNEKYKRYREAVNYFFNVKTKEQIDILEKEHSDITWQISKILEKNLEDKSNEKSKKYQEFQIERKKLEEELMKDEDITSVEYKKRLRDFDDNVSYEIKEIDTKYKDLFKTKENELLMNRDVKYKLLSKWFAETLTTSSIEYWEINRKLKIIQLLKEYFESRSNDINWIIMTLNVLYKNSVNLTWNFDWISNNMRK